MVLAHCKNKRIQSSEEIAGEASTITKKKTEVIVASGDAEGEKLSVRR